MKVLTALSVCAALVAFTPAHAAEAVPPVATKFLTLFDQLRAAQAEKAKGVNKPVSFQLTDREVNDYMIYALKTTPRPGLQSVTIKFFPHNYISTFTVVDFDAVEKWKPGTIPTLLKPVLSGKKSVWVDYRVTADRGVSTFSVEKAYYGSLRLPAFVVEKVIHIVAARQPEKYDTSKPMPLPFGLAKVWTGDHQVAGNN